uniref:Uncharacterized protein n=1 Tax=Oryza punctata TaxID=4537 RepID=A0A0E0MDM5_ORYPU
MPSDPQALTWLGTSPDLNNESSKELLDLNDRTLVLKTRYSIGHPNEALTVHYHSRKAWNSADDRKLHGQFEASCCSPIIACLVGAGSVGLKRLMVTQCDP